MSDLSTYLKGRRKGDFAKSVGIVPAYLSQILSGKRKPSYGLMLRIQERTSGVVDLNSWSPSNQAPASGSSCADGSLPEQKVNNALSPVQGDAA